MPAIRSVLVGACAALVCGVALGACAMSSPTTADNDNPPPMPPHEQTPTCDQDKAGWAVGKLADEALLAKARSDADALRVRVLKPGQMITMEFDATRLNLRVDSNNMVASVTCG